MDDETVARTTVEYTYKTKQHSESQTSGCQLVQSGVQIQSSGCQLASVQNSRRNDSLGLVLQLNQKKLVIPSEFLFFDWSNCIREVNK